MSGTISVDIATLGTKIIYCEVIIKIPLSPDRSDYTCKNT